MTATTLAMPRARVPLARFARGVAYSLRIRRPEFLVAEVPIVLLPALLMATNTAQLRTGTFVEGLVVMYLLFNFGDMVNCLYDRDLDATYKPHLSRAVYGLGVAAVRWQIAVTAVAIVVLAAHLAAQLDRWLFVPGILAGLALGAAYSRPPVRLKGRGVAQLVTLWAIIFVGPMAFISMLLAPMPSFQVAAVAIAYATVQMGIILLNTAEDFTEDRAAAVKTTIVVLGLRRGVGLAASLVGIGGTLLFVLMFLTSRGAWAFSASMILGAVILTVCGTLLRLHRTLTGEVSRDLPRVRRVAKLVPVALTLVAWTSLAVVYAALQASGSR